MRCLINVLFFALVASTSAAQTPSATPVVKNGVGPVLFLRYSPDGRELVRICQFGPVELFDTTSYDRARTFSVGMRMVAYSPDGTLIATAEGTDGARVWDSSIPGKRMADSPYAGTRYLLDTPLHVLQAPSTDAKQRVFRAEFADDGKHLITTHASGHVKVWNTTSWAVTSDLALTDAEVRAAAFIPDGKTLVIGDINGVRHEWTTERRPEVTIRTPGAITEIAFAPNGNRSFTTHQVASGGEVVIWDADRRIIATKTGYAAAAFSKDGRFLALGGTHIELLDPNSLTQIRMIELEEMSLRESHPLLAKVPNTKFPNAETCVPISITALAFAPDGRTLAAGCIDGTVRLIDLNKSW
jgi:WD40 repeat protein